MEEFGEAQIFGDFLGYFVTLLLSKNCFSYLIGSFGQKIELLVIQTSGHTAFYTLSHVVKHVAFFMCHNLTCFQFDNIM